MISRMRRAEPCGIRTWRSVWASAGLPSPEFDLSMTAAIDLAICTWPGIIRICPIFDDSSCWLYSNSIRFHMAWMFEVFLHQRNSLGFLYQQTIWIPLELQLSKSINHNTRGKQSNIGFLHSSFEVRGVAMLSVSPLAPVSIPSHLAPGLQPPAHTSSASSAGVPLAVQCCGSPGSSGGSPQPPQGGGDRGWEEEQGGTGSKTQGQLQLGEAMVSGVATFHVGGIGAWTHQAA